MEKEKSIVKTAYYHLPGLFEFYELYKRFLPLFTNHRKYFYEWCEIGSIYGAPADCIWGGGRAGFGDNNYLEVLNLMREHGISARLTFSNSLLREEHLSDRKCNLLCREFSNASRQDMFSEEQSVESEVLNGVIVHSQLLSEYLEREYARLYQVSSTTKVITDFDILIEELDNEAFRYVVPDFRMNKMFDRLEHLSQAQKDKVEFLCNECCWVGCKDRKECYENVSRRNLGEDCEEHICKAPNGSEGYRFSAAMDNPEFIGVEDITDRYLPMGFSNFKLEGRGLGSAVVLEMLLYYMVKPEYHLLVREEMYLDSMLDLY